MAIHDEYARLTPYEIALPGSEAAAAFFEAIAEEADARGTDPTDPSAFIMLAATGRALRQIRGDEDAPDLIHQYGALLFHAYHFHDASEQLYLLTTAAARYLADTDLDVDDWLPAATPPAAYVQLPQNLFWARAVEDGPAEPLDGIFWTACEEGSISVLITLGMRAGRPGLSVVPLSALPLDDVGAWARSQARTGEKDFVSTLPGGELERLYSIETTGEALKLLARVLWYLERFPDSVQTRASLAGPSTEDQPSAPAPSGLPYREITLT